jgi:ubiquinol oxidase
MYSDHIKTTQQLTIHMNTAVNMKIVCGIQSPRYAHTKKIIKTDKIPKSIGCIMADNLKIGFKTNIFNQNDPYAHVNTLEEKNDIRRFRRQMNQLTLDAEQIMIREHTRDQVNAPRAMMIVYNIICLSIDKIYEGKPLDRFWMLETIARQPYFSYVAILHMYETLGWWEVDGELRKAHAEEEYNETMHLKIMESMGADRLWWNRFLARHSSIAYFALLLFFYLFTPRLAYLSSELLERHAVDTYDQFYEENEEVLKNMACTEAALTYQPNARSMYDVFRSISNDENKHANAMQLVKELPN